MDNIQKITGILMIILGVILCIVGVFLWFLLIYGVPILIIGILILMNAGREDYVEPIKSKSIKKRKNSK